MLWLVYSLTTIALWGTWGVLVKLAFRHVDWVQASLVYGAMTVIGALILLATLNRKGGWTGTGLQIAAVTGIVGAGGLIAFYLAIERGKVSVVVPLVGGLYPVLTVVLSVLFLGERLSALQVAGIVCAVAAVTLISLGR